MSADLIADPTDIYTEDSGDIKKDFSALNSSRNQRI